MSKPYTPKAGTAPERMLRYLRSLPEGARASTAELARAANVPTEHVSGFMQTAVARGVVRREIAPDRRTMFSVPASDADDWPRQTVVPAAEAQPLKLGPSSVFTLAAGATPTRGQQRNGTPPAAKAEPKPAQTAAASDLAAGAFRIERGIPIPPIASQRPGVWARLLNRMTPGDSVELTPAQAKGLLSAARPRGVKLTRRTLAADRVRLWRMT